MSIKIYTDSADRVVIKGEAKLETPELEKLIASLMLELSKRMPMTVDEARLLGYKADEPIPHNGVEL